MSNPNLTEAERRALELAAAKPCGDARPSIPLASGALCIDCSVLFDMAGPCPKCGSEISWTAVSSTRAATVIRSQRELLDEAEGVLLTIAKMPWSRIRAQGLAMRMVERIRRLCADPEKKTPTRVSPLAGVIPT